MNSSSDQAPRAATRAAVKPTAARRCTARLMVNAALGCTIVAGWAYIIAGPAPAQRLDVKLPALQTAVDSEGATVVSLDRKAWPEACRRAGLPDPPDILNADPVPVRKLLSAVDEWIEKQNPASLARMGEIYLAMFLHEQALEYFVAASELEPANARWRYFVGAQCQTLGRVDQAIAALEATAIKDPEYPTTFARLGSLYLDRSDLEQAREAYQKYVMRRPTDSLGYVGLGRVALAQRDPLKAEELLLKAVQLAPSDFLAHRMLSRALAMNGKADEARQASAQSNNLPAYLGWLTFDQRLQEVQQVAGTQRYLEYAIQIAMGGNDLAQAIQLAEELVQRRPRDADTLALLAGLHHYRGEAQQAHQAIERAVQLAPDPIPIRCNQVEIAFAQKRLQP